MDSTKAIEILVGIIVLLGLGLAFYEAVFVQPRLKRAHESGWTEGLEAATTDGEDDWDKRRPCI